MKYFFDFLSIRSSANCRDSKNRFMKCVKTFKELIIILETCMFLKLNTVYLIMKEKHRVKRGRASPFLKIFRILGNNF